MSADGKSAPPPPLDERVGAQERRKVRARRQATNGIWLGFATFGLIGWSVAVPTLLGIALGIWLDHYHPMALSWTLTLLGVGIFLGCLNAWHWVSREHRTLREEAEENGHE
jgi:ATP synthase protein I